MLSLQCMFNFSCSFHAHLHLHWDVCLWSCPKVPLGWKPKVSLLVPVIFPSHQQMIQNLIHRERRHSRLRCPDCLSVIYFGNRNSSITLLPSDALSLISVEVPMIMYQDILEDYKEKDWKSSKNCKKIESVKLFAPEYTHTIQKRDVARVLTYLHFWFSVWPSAGHSSFLCLCFCICITEIIITSSVSHSSSEAYLVLSIHYASQNSGIIITNVAI